MDNQLIHLFVLLIYNRISQFETYSFYEGGNMMEELAKQVRNEMLRTLLWAAVACAVAGAVYYLVW